MTSNFPPSAAARAILHVDMDAFYCSVEQRDRPELKGQPVIVGGTGNRGVVAAASYEVRKFGVRSAMPMRDALQRCPHAICLPPRIGYYRQVSAQIFAVFREFTPLVEGLSLDEAFLDVTHSQAALGSAEQIAQRIKTRIHEQTQLTASVGVAPNKLLAKLASDMRKPDGLMIITPDAVTALLDVMPANRLFGIGNKTAPKLEALGIHTLRDLRLANPQRLQHVLGRHTAVIQARAAGIDDRPVIADWDEKQISSETTFDTDLREPARLQRELATLSDRTATRLRSRNLEAGVVIVKIRTRDFSTFTRQQPLRPLTQETRVISQLAAQLLQEWLREHPGAALRLLGVGVSELNAVQQMQLFAAPESERNRELDATVDRIREKFGGAALTRAEHLSRKE